MANFPYVASGGPLVKTVSQLRKSFPKQVTAETLKKLGLAPKNESYVINVLRFLGVLDDEGKKVEERARVFHQHDDASFQRGLEALLKEAYAELFELHGDSTWDLSKDQLTQFFRSADHSTDVVGRRQAGTFSHLAALAGHGEVPNIKTSSTGSGTKAVARKKSRVTTSSNQSDQKSNPTNAGNGATNGASEIGLTVRIEVNLPADGDQDTYDRIFRSIRKNLIDGARD